MRLSTLGCPPAKETRGCNRKYLTFDVLVCVLHGSYALSIHDGKPVLRLQYTYTEGTDTLQDSIQVPSAVAIEDTNWTHVAAVRYGDKVYLFVNGTLGASIQLPTDADIIDVDGGESELIIGADPSTRGDVENLAWDDVLLTEPLVANLTNVRISTIARYTNFITPDITDGGNDAVVLGGADIDTGVGKIGDSMAFDGTDDMLPYGLKSRADMKTAVLRSNEHRKSRR